MSHQRMKSFAAAITVCDVHRIILEMNNKAIDAFKEDVGEKLLGKNLHRKARQKS